jgi:hypothetical protein
MSEYDNTNTGALFENGKREKATHPHLRGSCVIKTPSGELVEYWVSAWQKTSKKGEDFFSLSFTQKDENGEKKEKPASPSGLFKKREESSSATNKSIQEDLNDDMPF